MELNSVARVAATLINHLVVVGRIITVTVLILVQLKPRSQG